MTTHVFHLPDLGEGLPDAEIVEWKVKVGDWVALDAPLVAMETAKAVVDVPSPVSGRVATLYGAAGDVIETGKPLVSFELNGEAAVATPTPAPSPTAASDSGTVVGTMQSSGEVLSAQAVSIGGVKALPATRALARKLGVDLASVVATGTDGVVTLDDVKRAATSGSGARPTPAPIAPAAPAAAVTAAPSVDPELPLRGVRRQMARTMAQAHAQVVPTTLMDDADLHAWAPGQDLTVRLIRALAVAARAEPGLNASFFPEQGTLRHHGALNLGIAVDTADGLFVPVIRDADRLDAARARAALEQIRAQVKARTIPPESLTGATLTLSNFGVYAGKYATPIVVPPQVAILAAGRLYHAAVPVMGGIEAHRLLPLSLTFDHRAVTGGEAARFLAALLKDLSRSS
jgi:2-oxoisovalerate dehydrogenase E2 component (dihydrolipoyl transacylase)